MTTEQLQRLRGLPAFLAARVLDQDEALAEISAVVMNVECGFHDPGEPRAAIMAFGPTGVGKTESFLALAEFLYGTPAALVRFDMSEFGTDEALPILLGDRSGDPGQLINRLKSREETGGIILWDEFEKASPAVRNLFLSILSSAKVTSWAGISIDLSRFYLCATSNVGGARTGSADESSDHQTLQKNLMQEAAKILSPELLGRFAIKPLFRALGDQAQLRVAGALLDREAAVMRRTIGAEISWSEDVLSRVVEWGFDRRLGARPMRDKTRLWVRSAVRELVFERGFPAPPRIQLTVASDAFQRLTALPA